MELGDDLYVYQRSEGAELRVLRVVVQADGTHNSEGAAPDGESYFAMALLFAANRWPGGKGLYDYRAEAVRLLHAMVHREVITAPGPRGRIAWERSQSGSADGEFVPEEMPHPFTDPSYHLPAFYELWARWGPAEDRDFWERAAGGEPRVFSEGGECGDRAGARLGELRRQRDAGAVRAAQRLRLRRVAGGEQLECRLVVVAQGSAEQTLSDHIQKFFESQGMDRYGPMFTLDGKPVKPSARVTHEEHPEDCGHERGGGAGSHGSRTRAAVHRGAVEHEDSFRAEPVLRWHAVPDEPDAPKRRVPDHRAKEMRRGFSQQEKRGSPVGRSPGIFRARFGRGLEC